MNNYKTKIFFNEEAYERLKIYLLDNIFSANDLFILVDNITNKYCLPRLLYYIDFLKKSNIIHIKNGEEKKNIYTCIEICKEIEKYKGTRNSLIINLGGGVLTDIGGFTASIFKRGIRYINIPTTLLGMVDAAIGYKTGVNLNSIKNELGTFYIPELLIIDTNFLKTLPDKEIISGMAEMFKHGLIWDKSFWKEMKENYFYIKNKNFSDKKNYLIKRSIEIKIEIVHKDPKEKGLRKILNFGHTIGHALESFFLNKKKIMHGVAIANGIIYESWISYKENKLSIENYNEIKSTLMNFYPIKKGFIDSEIKELINIMKHDKKNEKMDFQFSLLNKIGSCSYNCKIDNSIIKKSFIKLK
ncbi:3-dehydroquinate synthase [Blattabacterium cuenoti]|uniref:3-dehydroquinate synthase n=1 Tax=Blattabacterium cuenoti TaxID=1653831 RepID=UPI00163C4C33|nr:3-dehydroquinate synthase [Blattabacterium cuenoti]